MSFQRNKHFRAQSLYSLDFFAIKQENIQGNLRFNPNFNSQTEIIINPQTVPIKIKYLRSNKTSDTFRYARDKADKKYDQINKERYSNDCIRIRKANTTDRPNALNQQDINAFKISYIQSSKKSKKQINHLYSNKNLSPQKNQRTQEKQKTHSLIELLKRNRNKQQGKRQLAKNAKSIQRKCQKYQSERKHFQFLITKEKYLVTQEKEQNNNICECKHGHTSNNWSHSRNRLLKFDNNKDKICPWINYQETY